jgi:hypothetical protein
MSLQLFFVKLNLPIHSVIVTGELIITNKKMINPEDQIPFDDQENADKEDQVSQQDIHSNGLEEERTPRTHESETNPDALQQAYRASESAYLLGEEPGSDYRVKRKRKGNPES